MTFGTRLKLISMAISHKYDHINWYTFQLKGKRDDGRFETYIESYYEGKIQNSQEIIRDYAQKVIDNRGK